MKYLYVLAIFMIAISCKTQTQPDTSDATTQDSIESTPPKESTNIIKVNFCPDLVREIVKSSPRYKQLTYGLVKAVKKNDGTSVDIVLDKSPEPKKDGALEYSANYEMQLTENYPDRHVNIAHFSFNPQNNQLYEYDVVRDQLITVEYNMELLNNPEKYCK